MDEDELEALGESSLQTRQAYDTFGQAAIREAHNQAAAEVAQRPSLPGFIPPELLAPVPDSIGVSACQ